MARSAAQLISCLRDVFRERSEQTFDDELLEKLDKIIRIGLSQLDLDIFLPSFTLPVDKQEAFCEKVLTQLQKDTQGETRAYLLGNLRGLKVSTSSLSSSIASLSITPSPVGADSQIVNWADAVEQAYPTQHTYATVSKVNTTGNVEPVRHPAKRARVENPFNAVRAHGIAIASAKGFSYPYSHCTKTMKQCAICQQANLVIPTSACTSICSNKHGGKWAHWPRKSLNQMNKQLSGNTNLHNCISRSQARLFTADNFRDGTLPPQVLAELAASGKTKPQPAKVVEEYRPVSPSYPPTYTPVEVSPEILASLPPPPSPTPSAHSSVGTIRTRSATASLLHGLGTPSSTNKPSTSMET